MDLLGGVSGMPGTVPVDPEKKAQYLRSVSAEFEAVMTAALLKEGLAKAAASGAEESEGGSGTYMSFAYEQLAYHIGRQGVLGIADSITEQLGALPAEASDGLPN